MNIKAEKAVQLLKRYSEEFQVPPRSTSDLSPLESWLILEICKLTKPKPRIGEYARTPLPSTPSTPPLKKGTYSKALEEWNNSFYCHNCGYEAGPKRWKYKRTVANGECYDCPICKEEGIVDEKPKREDYEK